MINIIKYIGELRKRRASLHARKVAEEFAKAFPGRCLICAYHQFGIREGLTSGPVKEHECIETTLERDK